MFRCLEESVFFFKNVKLGRGCVSLLPRNLCVPFFCAQKPRNYCTFSHLKRNRCVLTSAFLFFWLPNHLFYSVFWSQWDPSGFLNFLFAVVVSKKHLFYSVFCSIDMNLKNFNFCFAVVLGKIHLFYSDFRIVNLFLKTSNGCFIQN